MGRKYGEWSHRTLNWDSDTDSIIYFDRIRTEYHGILVSNSTACDKLKTWKRSDFHKRVYWLVYWEPYFMAYEIYNSSFDLGRISFSKQTGFWSLQNVTFVRSRLPCYTFFFDKHNWSVKVGKNFCIPLAARRKSLIFQLSTKNCHPSKTTWHPC